MRDYFINEKRIQAFNIQDFIAGIVYAKDQGIPIDPESAVKVGYAYEVDLKEPSVDDNDSEDDNAGQSESQESNDSQESQASAEQETEQESEQSSGEASDIAIEDLQAMTTQELDDFASDCDFQQFKDFANGFGVTGRSKKDMLDKLKELRDS